MNTHIIIPIKDIEERIDNIVLFLKDNKSPLRRDWLAEKDTLKGILNSYKQISLDEKDIEEKANKACYNFDHETQMKWGYKQALKDLL